MTSNRSPGDRPGIDVEEDYSFQRRDWRFQRHGLVALLLALAVTALLRGGSIATRMKREGIDLSDILTAGREQHGLRQLGEIEYAVLERSGGLSIVPGERT